MLEVELFDTYTQYRHEHFVYSLTVMLYLFCLEFCNTLQYTLLMILNSCTGNEVTKIDRKPFNQVEKIIIRAFQKQTFVEFALVTSVVEIHD